MSVGRHDSSSGLHPTSSEMLLGILAERTAVTENNVTKLQEDFNDFREEAAAQRAEDMASREYNKKLLQENTELQKQTLDGIRRLSARVKAVEDKQETHSDVFLKKVDAPVVATPALEPTQPTVGKFGVGAGWKNILESAFTKWAVGVLVVIMTALTSGAIALFWLGAGA